MFDEAGAERIPFDVSEDRQQVFVLFDRKCLEASLPDMSAGIVVAMIPSHVRRHQPLHPTAQVAGRMRLQHQMEMIRHQHVAESPHGQAFVGRCQQVHDRRVIAVFMKYLGATVAPIENVLTNSTGRSSGSAGHATSQAIQQADFKEADFKK
jgi:hypothetical protein